MPVPEYVRYRLLNMTGTRTTNNPLAPLAAQTRHDKPLGPRVLFRLESGDDRTSGGLLLRVRMLSQINHFARVPVYVRNAL